MSNCLIKILNKEDLSSMFRFYVIQVFYFYFGRSTFPFVQQQYNYQSRTLHLQLRYFQFIDQIINLFLFFVQVAMNFFFIIQCLHHWTILVYLPIDLNNLFLTIYHQTLSSMITMDHRLCNYI